ncbi:hypothetical protein AB0F17_28890 [Nonomuraea sp. NPDC026600]|uniref:hypothetical protein n=1 Tax=Nonomuraea sp. NPDC026600 TaxID=3155363 RepID=UPI0033F5ADFB
MDDEERTAPRLPWWGLIMCVILVGHVWMPYDRPGERVEIRCDDCGRLWRRRARRRRVEGRGPRAVVLAWLLAAGLVEC